MEMEPWSYYGETVSISVGLYLVYIEAVCHKSLGTDIFKAIYALSFIVQSCNVHSLQFLLFFNVPPAVLVHP